MTSTQRPVFTYWGLYPNNEMFQFWASSVDDLVNSCPTTGADVCALSIDNTVLGKYGDNRRVQMLHYSFSPPQASVMNLTATRILVDKGLLDTVAPLKELEHHRFDGCAFAIAIFFVVDRLDHLMDYNALEIRRDWPLFFIKQHPSVSDSPLLNEPYIKAASSEYGAGFATGLLKEKFSGTLGQRQRIEATLLGSELYRRDPQAWLKANDFDATIKMYFAESRRS
jgi:hypothetical protein